MKAPALVVDVGWVNGLAAIRSLGRAGVPVVAVDHRRERARLPLPVRASPRSRPTRRTRRRSSRSSPGSGSCAGSGLRHPRRALNAIARGAERLGGGSSTRSRLGGARADPDQARPARGRARRPACRCRAPRIGLGRRGAGAAEELGFPVLVKPSVDRGLQRRFGRQAFRCETAARSRRPSARRAVRADGAGVDSRRGRELYTLGSYLAADGEALGLFCGRKLRQTPRESAPAAWARRSGSRRSSSRGSSSFVRSSYHGLSQVEFKRDPRDGYVQADGGQPAPVAVARARGGLRRRPPADRLPGPGRRAARPGAMNGAAAAGRSRSWPARPRLSGRRTWTPSSRATTPSRRSSRSPVC